MCCINSSVLFDMLWALLLAVPLVLSCAALLLICLMSGSPSDAPFLLETCYISFYVHSVLVGIFSPSCSCPELVSNPNHFLLLLPLLYLVSPSTSGSGCCPQMIFHLLQVALSQEGRFQLVPPYFCCHVCTSLVCFFCRIPLLSNPGPPVHLVAASAVVSPDSPL